MVIAAVSSTMAIMSILIQLLIAPTKRAAMELGVISVALSFVGIVLAKLLVDENSSLLGAMSIGVASMTTWLWSELRDKN